MNETMINKPANQNSIKVSKVVEPNIKITRGSKTLGSRFIYNQMSTPSLPA